MCTYVYVCIYIYAHICMYIVYTLLLSNYCQKKEPEHTPYFAHSIYIYIYVCNIYINAILGKYVRCTMLNNTHSILYIVVGKNMYIYNM